jgi:mRNA interferase MazF
MKPGEIYLAMFPFGDAPGMKLRPVLTLSPSVGPVPEVLVAYISSVIPATLLPTDLLLDPSRSDGKGINLKVTSILRLHKLATIHATGLARRLGAIPSQLSPEVSKRLRAFLNL